MAAHVTAHHLTRLACLYIRQSTLQQVFENTESTSRQYALRERARALGWANERIVVIDQDLGHSGASTTDRLGFQQLVAEVGLGHVGVRRPFKNGCWLCCIFLSYASYISNLAAF